jgi:hypothetical protein
LPGVVEISDILWMVVTKYRIRGGLEFDIVLGRARRRKDMNLCLRFIQLLTIMSALMRLNDGKSNRLFGYVSCKPKGVCKKVVNGSFPRNRSEARSAVYNFALSIFNTISATFFLMTLPVAVFGISFSTHT